MLGERLLTRGAISADQLESALEEQRSRGGLLGDVLRRLNFVSEDGLSRSLAEEAAVPFVTPAEQRPDPAAACLVDEPFARRHLIVPLGFRDDELEVLQANPFDVIAVDEVERLAGRPVRVVCGTRSDVLRLIDRSYHRPPKATSEIVQPPGPAPAASRRPPLGSLEELGMTRRQVRLVQGLLSRRRGIVVVCGKSGAGVSTTMAVLQEEKPGTRVVGALPTVEASVPPAFASAMSEGLVIASCHGTNAGPAASRLIEWDLVGSQTDQAAAVIAQRLVPLVCPHCRAISASPAESLASVGLTPEPGLALYRGRGCDRCGGTGHLGCAGVFEILVVDAALLARVTGGHDPEAVRRAAIGLGMRTLTDHALTLAIFGRTTLEEVLKVADG
jgi:type IV pilus assembly protein PilB